MLQFHIDRLWESAEATGLGPAATAEGRESLQRRTTETIARVMELFWEGKLNEECDVVFADTVPRSLRYTPVRYLDFANVTGYVCTTVHSCW